MTPAFYSPGGSFSTAKLVAIAAELRALGWSEVAIRDKVYAPFILAGKAAWVDTWGAPRYGPAPGQIRSHEGQDVFCQYGEPVLAAARGSIEFDSGGLGGHVARLHLANGWYWYYAHLSGWNTERFHDGDRVRPGDVIGYCGNSGDAISTSPHVHFSLYDRDVRAHNPMRALVSWLHEAERHATRALARASGKRVQDISLLTLARRLGEGMLPDPARYEDSSLRESRTWEKALRAVLRGWWERRCRCTATTVAGMGNCRPTMACSSGAGAPRLQAEPPAPEKSSEASSHALLRGLWEEPASSSVRYPESPLAGCPSGQRERSVKSPA